MVEPEYSSYGEFLRVSTWNGEASLPKIEIREPMQREAEAFVRAIQEGRVERSDGEAGLAVVRTLEAAGESMRQGGHPVTPA
jgi:predicted dehydrogenase